MNPVTPAQAIENLAKLADEVPLNGPSRRLINESIRVLYEIVTPKPEAEVPKGL